MNKEGTWWGYVTFQLLRLKTHLFRSVQRVPLAVPFSHTVPFRMFLLQWIKFSWKKCFSMFNFHVGLFSDYGKNMKKKPFNQFCSIWILCVIYLTNMKDFRSIWFQNVYLLFILLKFTDFFRPIISSPTSWNENFSRKLIFCALNWMRLAKN